LQNSKIVRHVKKINSTKSSYKKKREKLGENEIEKEITSAQKLSGKKTDRRKNISILFSTRQIAIPLTFHTHFGSFILQHFPVLNRKNLKYF